MNSHTSKTTPHINSGNLFYLFLLGLIAALTPLARAVDYEISSGTTAYPSGLHLNEGDAIIHTGGTLFVGGAEGITGDGVYNISQGSLVVDGSDLTIAPAIVLHESTAGPFVFDTASYNASITNNITTDATGNYGSGGNGFLKTGEGRLTLSGESREFNTLMIAGGGVSQTAGLTQASELAIGTGAGKTATYELSSGTINVVQSVKADGVSFQAGSFRVGDFGGSGTFNQTGGSVIVSSTGAFNIGNQGGTGVYNLSGGELVLNQDLHNIGRSAGSNAASHGTVNISGGTLALQNGAEFIVGNYNKDDASQGIVNQTGGVVTVDDGSRIYFQGKSTTTTSKYNLDGGVLQIAGNGLKALNGVLYEFNFGSGTMQAAGEGMSSEANINLTAGTAVFDTNGLESTLTGVITGGGKLTLAGDGVLQLGNAANNLSGGIDLARGGLRITSAESLGTKLSNVNFAGTPETTSGTLIAAANSNVLFDNEGGAGGNRIDITTGKSGALHAEAGSTLTIAGNDAGANSGGAINVGAGARFDISAADGATLAITSNTAFGGGAIQNEGRVNISNAALSHNVSTGTYGAALSNSGEATLTAVEIFSNTANRYGGAIHNTGTLTLANANIHDNYADQGAGGMTNRAGVATITSSTLSNNTGDQLAGGALYVYSGGTLTLDDVLFASNTTNGNGGGGAMITEGSDTRVNGSGVRFENNYAEGIGGAIRNNGGELSLSQFEFTGNRSNAQGGAIHNGYSTTLESGTFAENTSSAEGGAIYNLLGEARLTVTDALFSSNTATGKGGAVYNYGGEIAFDQVTFSNNTVLGSNGAGGAIHNENANVRADVSNALFDGNTAAYGAAISNKAGAITITSATFANNTAGAAGGAIYNYGSGTMTFVDVLFDGNAASDELSAGGGGAIFNEASYPNVITGTNVVFSNNTASSAGALRNNNAYVALTSATFSNNQATTGGGGAIYTAGTLSLTDASFIGNSAHFADSGGAIYVESGLVELNVTAGNNSLFEGNTSAGVANSIRLAAAGTLAVNTGAGATLDTRDPVSGNAASGNTLIITKAGEGAWNLGGANTFTQDGTGKTILSVQSGVLAVGEDSALRLDGADSVLEIAAGATLGVAVSENPSVTTGNLNAAAGSIIDVDGYDGSTGVYTLVSASNAIARDYKLTVGGAELSTAVTEDVFIAMQEDTSDANQIRINANGLVWNNTAVNSAHGTFLIDAGVFTLSATLADNFTAGARMALWDGESLKKTGAGTLVLTAHNTYTGTTFVEAGALINTGTLDSTVKVDAGLFRNDGEVGNSVTNAALAENNGLITGDVTNTGTFANAGTISGAFVNNGGEAANDAAITGIVTIAAGSFANNSAGTLDTLLQSAGFVSNGGLVTTATVTGGETTNTGTITTLSQTSGVATNNAFISDAALSDAASLANSGTIDSATLAGGLLTNSGEITTAATITGGTLSNTGGSILGAATIDTAGTLIFESGAIANALVNNGVLTYANADAHTQSSEITGSGRIAKTGAGDLTIGAGVSAATLDIATGKLTIADTGTLTLTGALNVGADSTLGITIGTGTSVIADTANFNETGKLDITGYSDANAGRTVIHTTGGITGFSSSNVTIASQSTVDYMKATAGIIDTDLVVDTVLSWNLTDGTAHGNFTIAEDQTFTVSSALADNTVASAGWDGASLTKLGEGTLVLSGENTYTGTTTVSAGTLENTGIIAGALVDNAAVLLNTGTITADVSNAATATNSGLISGEVTNSGALTNNADATLAALNQIAGATGNAGLVTEATVSGGELVNTGTIDNLAVTDAASPVAIPALARATALAAEASGTVSNDGLISNAVISGGELKNNSGATITALDQTGGVVTNAGFIASAITSGGLTNSGTLDSLEQSAGLVTNDGVLATAVAINGGTLANNGVVAAATTIGADGTLLFNSGSLAAPVANEGALTFANDDAYTLDQVVSGGGSLNKTGAGDLIIAVAQSHTGNTSVGNGTLVLGAANALASSALVDLAANTTLDLGGFNQSLNALSLANGSLVNFNSVDADYATLTVGTLSGSGSFAMRADPAAGAAAHDTLAITDAASTGNYQVSVALDSAITDSLQVIETTAPSVIFTGTAEYGLDAYTLEKTNSGWQLGLAGNSTAGDVVLSTAAVLSSDWLYGLDSVNLRLGDLRATPAARGDVWVRTNAYRLNGAPGAPGDTFRQTTWGVTAGADAAITAAESGNAILLGGFVQAGRSDRTYDHSGKSDTDTFAFGVYGTALLGDGWFIDATLKYDRYKNDLDARGAGAVRTTADYNNSAFGISLEAGRRITLSTDKRYWVEPSVQVATVWIDSANYTTNDGLRVDIGSSTAWQYRAQVRAGANYGKWIPYVKFAGAGLDTDGGKVRTDANDRTYTADFDGARFETGVGVGYLINSRSQLYLDYEYSKSSSIERPWAVNLGFHRVW
ncbi:autotransporter outer membrane beta-barrel domain-containing protein [Ereboglobus luteus]|uniref:Autotransporter domain-containing protein n=1 Tax=Ereboglobus luteus TaxID=1796921 RepID=A0A2U8E0V2_9BACT|nr:autotransporter outer membrane beta-barrel domain-containing protein [Ereboglobus luteus]AWI08405.1 hypothetical protein CKA38_03290 [Ereboglobus luteus]